MSRYRPGSRINQVHTEFVAKGADAAHKLGQSLDLAASTLRNWINGWLREGGQAPATVARHIAFTTKPRVRVEWCPDIVTYLLEEGPQQSEIRFDDPTGRYPPTQIIPNSHFVKL